MCIGTVSAPCTVPFGATGSGELTYQWQSSIDGGVNWTNIVWATSATYSPPALSHTTLYQRIVTSTLNGVTCTATSNVITITVNPIPSAPTGTDGSRCGSGTVILNASG